MGCASSSLLGHDDDFTQIGTSSLGHHIVSLTSTTYGLLTLDPPPSDHRHQSPTTTPPPRFTIGSLFPTPPPHSDLKPLRCEPPEVINSWELMAGLDPITTDSFRFSPHLSTHKIDKENSNPNLPIPPKSSPVSHQFESLCPPNGEDKVVIYTTTLRGVRRTFEACNAVRAAIQGAGVAVCERDISMDKGFREELRELLMKGKKKKEEEEVSFSSSSSSSSQLVPPRVFVKGRYVGGYEEVMRIVEEEGGLSQLLQGLPKSKIGYVCEGCGGARFLPCFGCNGSCKVVVVAAVVEEEEMGMKQGRTVVVRCPDCNENGLVLCPICS